MGYVRRSSPRAAFRVDGARPRAGSGAGPVLVHEVTHRQHLAERTRSGAWFEYWAANPFDQADKCADRPGPGAHRRRRRLLLSPSSRLGGHRPARAHDLRGGARRPRRRRATDGARFSRRRRRAPAGRGCRPGGWTRRPRGGGRPGARGRTISPSGASWMAAARRPRDAALRLRHRARAADPRAGRRPPRGPRAFDRSRGWGALVPRSGSAAGAPGSRASCSGTAYMLRSASPTRSARAGGSSRRAATTSTTSASRAPSATRSSTSAADLRRAGARPRVLCTRPPSSRGGRADPLRDELAVPAYDARPMPTTWTCGCCGRRRSTCWPTRDLGFLERRCGSPTAAALAVGAPAAGVQPTRNPLLGPHGGYLTRRDGRLVGLLHRVPADDRVDARLRASSPTSTRALAELADAAGDRAFAGRLRDAGARALATTGASGRAAAGLARLRGERQIGTGAIFGEPQPWALLAGRADRLRRARWWATSAASSPASALPPSVHGPAQDRLVAVARGERPGGDRAQLAGATATGDNNAVYVGGSWYAVNGWLTWALGRQAGVVPRPRELAFDELRATRCAPTRAPIRGTGAARSRSTTSAAPISPAIRRSAASASPAGYSGQIMHQPAWLLWDTIKLAGIEPTTHGYTFPTGAAHARLLTAPAERRLEWGARARLRLRPGAAPRPPAHGRRARPPAGRYRALVEGRPVPSRRRGPPWSSRSSPARATRSAGRSRPGRLQGPRWA
jgi:hypothetical protein